ncbi:MAG: hypothetical protein DLM60_10795 [Pseudonocardiales bacterium]|nr:hypothetical protein [Actinomycetota bacterium]PZS19052.1 MAG: hypothetical protein DLM60_10795 [Pseudonocardiales bacterium]
MRGTHGNPALRGVEPQGRSWCGGGSGEDVEQVQVRAVQVPPLPQVPQHTGAAAGHGDRADHDSQQARNLVDPRK